MPVDLERYDSPFDRGRSAVTVIIWEMVQSILIRGSLHHMYAWRRFWYRLFGARIGRGVLIRRTVTCKYPWRVTIGDHAWIGDEAHLYSPDRIEIGPSAVVSQQAYLCTGTHDRRDPRFGLITKPIVVGAGAWVGLGALVMPGVTVGEGAVVGARSVLTRDAQPWTVYAGQPARAIGPRELRDDTASVQRSSNATES